MVPYRYTLMKKDDAYGYIFLTHASYGRPRPWALTVLAYKASCQKNPGGPSNSLLFEHIFENKSKSQT